MANMSLKKNEMPVQDPHVRNGNFLEVALGYTEEQAVNEAERCLNCKNKPCVGRRLRLKGRLFCFRSFLVVSFRSVKEIVDDRLYS